MYLSKLHFKRPLKGKYKWAAKYFSRDAPGLKWPCQGKSDLFVVRPDVARARDDVVEAALEGVLAEHDAGGLVDEAHRLDEHAEPAFSRRKMHNSLGGGGVFLTVFVNMFGCLRLLLLT